MHEPVLVQRVEARRHLLRDLDDVREPQRPLGVDAVLERAPADVRDGEELAAVELACVEDRHEVRVAHLGRAARLVHEPPRIDGVLEQRHLQHLQRDRRVVVGARRAEDEAHPAFAEQLLEPVRPEGVAGLQLTMPRAELHGGKAYRGQQGG